MRPVKWSYTVGIYMADVLFDTSGQIIHMVNLYKDLDYRGGVAIMLSVNTM